MKLVRGVVTVVVLVGALALVGSALMQFQGDDVPRLADVSERSGEEGRIRVEVLNGSGVSGAARAATARLRDQGFDVVYFGNAEEFGRDSTLVLDRVGEVEHARSVADAMGVRQVASEPDANLYVDVSVWLGADWTPPEELPDVAPPRRPWWDLRGLLTR